MSKLITRLLFKMMPKVAGMTSYAGQLIMYDNLDHPIGETYNENIKAFLKMLPMTVDFTVVILCVDGHVNLRCNLRDFALQRNSLVVIPQGTQAEKLELMNDATVVVMALPNLSYAPPSSFHNSIFASSNFTSTTFIEMEDSEVKQALGIYRMLKQQIATDEKEVNSDLVRAYILLMAGVSAVAFQRWKIRNKQTKISKKENIYKEFLTRLSEEYREHRDVAYYAEQAGLTPKYFASTIYDASGNHPLDLIKEQVVLDAQQLLKNGKSISEVCEILNFSSQSQFTNYFKAAVGVPPGEFLKSQGL